MPDTATAPPRASDARYAALTAGLAALLVGVLGAGLALAAEVGLLTRESVNEISSWIGVPGDLLVVVFTGWLVILGRTGRLRRLGWLLVGTAAAISLFMTLAWTRIEAHDAPSLSLLADVLYQAYYPLTSIACCAFFAALGGSFRRQATWLDLATILFAVMATLWSILYEPPSAFDPERPLNLTLKMSYTVGIGVTMSMAAIVYTRLRDWRWDPAMTLVVGATVVAAATDAAWLAHTVVGHGVLGVFSDLSALLFATGDLVSSALLLAALSREFSRPPPVPTAIAERAIGPYSLLPVLALMLSITMFVTTEAHRRGIGLAALVGLLVVGSLLLLARQHAVAAAVQRVNRALAVREAEARLTELVRCSSDVIAIVGAQRTLGFVSPAAEPVLGVAADSLVRQPADLLLGAAHAPALTGLLERLDAAPAGIREIDLSYGHPTGAARWLRVVGHNQLRNPLIEGVVLTITDITEQRTLQREVLDVASRERQRLSSDIHEGLGQELTGVAMLLKGAVVRARREPESLEPFLEQVSAHVSKAIGTARQLARGLSPLAVEKGSLGASIRRLALELNERLPVTVDVLVDVDEGRIDESMADHLYRIAYEGLNNALRHGDPTQITVSLIARGPDLALCVTDDGRGPIDDAGEGLGRRMMEYRTRLMGGTIRFGPAPGSSGASLTVTVPRLPG